LIGDCWVNFEKGKQGNLITKIVNLKKMGKKSKIFFDTASAVQRDDKRVAYCKIKKREIKMFI
jgi:hypothetical protein